MRVYFDNAATTPLDREVIDAMIPYMESHFGNPSAIHFYGRETRAAIEKARKTVAKYLNCSPGEIFFTSGGTEANNMAIRSAVKAYNLRHIISSPIEHHCVEHTVSELKKDGIAVHLVRVDPHGRIDLNHLEELLRSIGDRCLVSLMHANNEIGTMIDLNAAGEIVKKHDGIFHSDTVQTIAHFPFDLKNTPVDFISGAAHKFHGPKGVGFIYIRHGNHIPPLLFGGAQERNMRAGTENVYGIVGLAKALEMGYEKLTATSDHIKAIKQYMWKRLKNEFSDVGLNGDLERSLYTVLNVSFPLNNKTQLLLFNLDMAGICASSGSACSSGSNETSHVLEAIQSDPNRVAIRFSFSKYNTFEEVDYVTEKLKVLAGESQAAAL
jgi:cysteine desulfurase